MTTTATTTATTSATDHSGTRWYRTHAPLVSTYTLAISCLSRIGTQPALSAAIRLWHELVRVEPPFVPSAARTAAHGGAGAEGLAKGAYAKAAYEVVRMAVMGVRERTAVWAAVKAVAGGSAAFDSSAEVAGEGGESKVPASAVGAFHPARFPPASSPASLRTNPPEVDLLARVLHNALGRIMSGDGRPGDLSAQLGPETVRVLEAWRARLKAFLSVPNGRDGRRDAEAEHGTAERPRRREGSEHRASDGRMRRGGGGGGGGGREDDASSSARLPRSTAGYGQHERRSYVEGRSGRREGGGRDGGAADLGSGGAHPGRQQSRRPRHRGDYY